MPNRHQLLANSDTSINISLLNGRMEHQRVLVIDHVYCGIDYGKLSDFFDIIITSNIDAIKSSHVDIYVCKNKNNDDIESLTSFCPNAIFCIDQDLVSLMQRKKSK